MMRKHWFSMHILFTFRMYKESDEFQILIHLINSLLKINLKIRKMKLFPSGKIVTSLKGIYIVS